MVSSMSSKLLHYVPKVLKKINSAALKSNFFNLDKAQLPMNDSFFSTSSRSMQKSPGVTRNRHFNKVSLNQPYDLKKDQQQAIAKYLHGDSSKLGNSPLKKSLASDMKMTLSSSEKTQTFQGFKKILEFFQQHSYEIKKLQPDLSGVKPILTVEGVLVNKNNSREKQSFKNILHFNLQNQIVSIQSNFSKLP